jgi:hypothetical protein
MAKIISGPARLLRQKRREFRLLALLCFFIFLIPAVIARVAPKAWRRAVENGNRRHSIVAEAWASAHTFLPYVSLR